MKKITIFAVLVMAFVSVNAQNKTAEYIKALEDSIAQFKEDIAMIALEADATAKGCFHRRYEKKSDGSLYLKEIENCNGWYLGVGGGAQLMQASSEQGDFNPVSAVATISGGYRHFWFRPEVSVTFGTRVNIEERSFRPFEASVMGNIDFARHCAISPYVGAGISYENVRSSKIANEKFTGIYNGNMLKPTVAAGAFIRLFKFNEKTIRESFFGVTKETKKVGRAYLNLNCKYGFGSVEKADIEYVDNEPYIKPVGELKIGTITASASLVVKF
jgi:opacity protein-like surface antigen